MRRCCRVKTLAVSSLWPECNTLGLLALAVPPSLMRTVQADVYHVWRLQCYLTNACQARSDGDAAVLRHRCATAAKERAALRVILDAKIRGLVSDLAAGLREAPLKVRGL